MNEIHQRVFKIWGLINFNRKTLTLWLFYKNSKSVTLFPRSPRGGDGADKNFRPISTIMPYMNKIHQRVFKIWGLITFNAKTLTLWRKDERMNERTNERTYVRTNKRTNRRTEKQKLYTPTYFVCRGYNKRERNTEREEYRERVIHRKRLWIIKKKTICVHVFIHRRSISPNVYIHTAYIHTFALTYTHINTHRHTHSHAHIHVHTYALIHEYIHISRSQSFILIKLIMKKQMKHIPVLQVFFCAAICCMSCMLQHAASAELLPYTLYRQTYKTAKTNTK